MHDLLINSPVIVYREGNVSQSREWKGPYNLLSIQGESVIIELPHGPTKFRSTSTKPYFIDNQEFVSDSIAPTQIPPAEVTPEEILQIEAAPADIPPIEPTAKPPPAPLASLGPIKRGRGRPKKYSE